MNFEIYCTIKDLGIIPDNRKEYWDYLEKNDGKKGLLSFHRETGIRTLPQNNSLHLGCELIANALNDAGLDIRKVIKPTVEIPWNKYMVKEYLIRPVMKVMTGKESTRELNKTNEPSDIWDVVMRHLQQNHGMEYIPFPNKDLSTPTGL